MVFRPRQGSDLPQKGHRLVYRQPDCSNPTGREGREDRARACGGEHRACCCACCHAATCGHTTVMPRGAIADRISCGDCGEQLRFCLYGEGMPLWRRHALDFILTPCLLPPRPSVRSAPPSLVCSQCKQTLSRPPPPLPPPPQPPPPPFSLIRKDLPSTSGMMRRSSRSCSRCTWTRTRSSSLAHRSKQRRPAQQNQQCSRCISLRRQLKARSSIPLKRSNRRRPAQTKHRGSSSYSSSPSQIPLRHQLEAAFRLLPLRSCNCSL